MGIQIVEDGSDLSREELPRTCLQFPCGTILSYQEVYKPGTHELRDDARVKLDGLHGNEFENKIESLMGRGMLLAWGGCRTPWEFRYHVEDPDKKEYGVYVCGYHSRYIQQVIGEHLRTSYFTWGVARRSIFEE